MSNSILIRNIEEKDIEGVIALQKACFPHPFPEENLWKPEHIKRHLEIFPEGQFVAFDFETQEVVASASSCRISEAMWQSHKGWEETLGGYFFDNFDPAGTTLYGADISVHPDFRNLGIGKKLYKARFNAVKNLTLIRYGTACRIPDFECTALQYPELSTRTYCEQVVEKIHSDRTLSPLLKMGLTFVGVISNYMIDKESGNAAAILEWTSK